MTVLKRSGKDTLAVNLVMLLLSTTSVALRMLAKRKVRQLLRWEDAFILLALVSYYAYIIITLFTMVKAGGTLSVTDILSVGTLSLVLKKLYFLEILMGTILTLTKISILLWYRTALSARAVNIPTYVVGGFCVAWYLITLFIIIFQCNPVPAVWDVIESRSDKCTDFGTIILGYEISNIMLDISILAIPIIVIRKLQLSIEKKLMLCGVFLLGSFVCLTCIIRIVYLYRPNDPSKVDIYRGLLWSTIELGVAICCACLPTMRPLFRSELSTSPPWKWYSRLTSHNTRSEKTTSVTKNTTESDENVRYLNLERGSITAP